MKPDDVVLIVCGAWLATAVGLIVAGVVLLRKARRL